MGGYENYFSIIVKTDSNGDTLWTKDEINGLFSGSLYLTDILIEEDTVYIIGRVYPTISTDGSIVIFKTKSDGEVLWTKYYNDQYSSQWSGYYGTFTNNNTLYIAGSPYNYEQMIYVFEIKKNGDLIWEKYYGEFGTDYLTLSMTNCYNNSIAITGYNNGDVFLLKLGEKPSQISTLNDPNYLDFKIYPNPAKLNTNIDFSLPYKAQTRITIYTLFGEEIGVLANKPLRKGNYTFKWNTTLVPNGIYFCKVEFNNKFQVKKIIVSK